MPRKGVSVKDRKIIEKDENERQNHNGDADSDLKNNDPDDKKDADVYLGEKTVPAKRGKKNTNKIDNDAHESSTSNNEKASNGDLKMEVDIESNSSEGKNSNHTDKKRLNTKKEINSGLTNAAKARATRGKQKIVITISKETDAKNELDDAFKENADNLAQEDTETENVPNKEGRRKRGSKASQVLTSDGKKEKEEEKHVGKLSSRKDKKKQETENTDEKVGSDGKIEMTGEVNSGKQSSRKGNKRQQENQSTGDEISIDGNNEKDQVKNPSKQNLRKGNKKREESESNSLEVGADANSASSIVEKTIPTKRGQKRKNESKHIKKPLDTINEGEDKSAAEIHEENLHNEKNTVTKELRVLLKREKNLERAEVTDEIDEELTDEIAEKPVAKKGKQETVGISKTAGGIGGKRKKTKDDNQDESEDDFKPKKAPKVPKDLPKSKSSSKKEKIPDVSALNFSNDSVSSSGKPWNIKISSWNINGVRAWLEKDGISYLHHEKPDIMCVQETKCSEDKLPNEAKKVEGYHTYWLAGDKDGYSGVGLLSKEKPIDVQYGIAVDEHDKEGRVITAEYDKFYVVASYVPNAGRGLVRLDYRMQWDKDFCNYLKKLKESKPVILCGDLNVAHEEIDLANPKTNKKNAGFTKEERDGFSALLKEGFIDTFRHLYPDAKAAYTFWTYMMNARAKNVGWRLDYFVVSNNILENICDSVIRKDVYGSDHCPIALFISM